MALARLKAAVDERKRRGGAKLMTGVEAVDMALPGGGLAVGGVHELWDGAASGFAAAAAQWVAGLLADGTGPVLWCSRGLDLYGPGLAALGFDPERLIAVRTRQDADTLWALEEALRHGGLAAAVGEVGFLDLTASRRLQLAAERTGTPAFVLRRPHYMREQRVVPTAVETRWRVSPAPASALAVPGLGAPHWRLELLKARNGRTGEWMIDWNHETLSFHLSSHLVARPAALAADDRDRFAATG